MEGRKMEAPQGKGKELMILDVQGRRNEVEEGGGESVMQHPTTLTLVAAHAARSGQKQQQVVAGGTFGTTA